MSRHVRLGDIREDRDDLAAGDEPVEFLTGPREC
jgi:hypothetical protein